jgi:hypothetical protein
MLLSSGSAECANCDCKGRGTAEGGGEDEPHIGDVLFQDKSLGSDFAEFVEILRRLKIGPNACAAKVA